MTDYFVSQSGAGAMDGTSVANAWPYASINWTTVQNNVLYILGTITSNFSVGAHSSASGTPFQLRGDYAGNPGDILVTSGNALTIPNATSRNNTHVYNLTVKSTANVGIRMDSGVGCANRHFYGVTSNDNSSNGITIATDNGDDWTNLRFEDCTFSGNGTHGVQIVQATNSNCTIDQLVFENCTANSNSQEGFECRMLASNSTTTLMWDDWTFNNCEAHENGTVNKGRGFRIGDVSTDANNRNRCGKLTFTNNKAYGNGKEDGGGGAVLTGWHTGNGKGSHVDGTYIAYNTCRGNGGENGGINFFAHDGLAEFNVCCDQYVGTGVIDGNGFITDGRASNAVYRWNHSSGNLGSDTNNSGCGWMTLWDTEFCDHYGNWGYGNKIGIWSSHNESTQTQNDIAFYNNTYRDNTQDGFKVNTAGGSPLENTVNNNLFTGASGSNYGITNGRSSEGDIVANYNGYFGFGVGNYENQTAGANDITTDPTFATPATEFDEDFSGTSGLTLDELATVDGTGNGWTIVGGVEGGRVLEVNGSGEIICQDNGDGGAGVQTLYYAPDCGEGDHYVEGTIPAGWTTAAGGQYICMRISDDDNMIVLRIVGTGASGVRVLTRFGGTETQILAAQPTAGSVYRVECKSQVIELFKDGTSQGTARVEHLTHSLELTRTGMWAQGSSTNAQWSNLKTGPLRPKPYILTGSPAKNAGTTTSYTTDPDGEPYQQGGGWDMGAFAFVAAPTLTTLVSGTVAATTIDPDVTTDKPDGTLYTVVVPDGDAPSAAQIIAGTDSTDTAAVASVSQSITAVGATDITQLTGLSAGTAYELASVQVDAVQAQQSNVLTIGFTTSGGDVTAPTLTSPEAQSIGITTVTPAVTTNEGNGTLYVVVVPDGDAPSVAQIKAGQQSDSSAAVASANQAVSATGSQVFSQLTGLTSNTAYELYFVHTDAATNDSAAATVGFTTLTSGGAVVTQKLTIDLSISM